MPANKILLKLLLVSGAVLSGIIVGCTKADVEIPMIQKISEDSLKLSDEAIKNLKLEKVTKGDFPEKLSLMGKISVPEDRTVVVPARVSGRTDQIYVSSGEVVTAGQPLCSIFSSDFAVAHEEYLQTLHDAKANPKDEEAQHMLALSRKKLTALGVSELDYQKWASAGVNTKGENLLVRAPIGGALLTKNATLGNLVNVGDTMFIIGDMKKVWFAGDIYPEDLPKIKKDQDVIIDPGNGESPLKGKVSFISPAMDPTSRTIKIRALIENPGSQLRADMYVQGDIIISTRTALIAPKNALVRLKDSTFCYKSLPDNVFKRVPIVTGGQSSDSVAITSGLDEGDEVVSSGGLFLDAALHGAGT